jgi:pSer/pThr/pTyr-binding forkhead associated (FHA) protein
MDMRFVLKIKFSDDEIQIIELLKNEIILGRSPDVDLSCPADPALSNEHLALMRTAEDWTVVDLGSQNGTFINGLHLRGRHQLNPGDCIMAGHLTLTYAVHPEDITPQGERRLRELSPIWSNLEDSLRASNELAYVQSARTLLRGIFRQAVGYIIEFEVPNYRGIVGSTVKAPTLPMRQSHFPIIIVPYSPERSDEICVTIREWLSISPGSDYLVIVIPVRATPTITDEAQALSHSLLRFRQAQAEAAGPQRSSVMPHDFIVLDRHHIQSIVAGGDSKRFVEIVRSQGVELSALSPYVTAGPVPDGMFFGREREIKTIQASIQSGSFAVLGGRRIGKTSVLQRVF